MMQDLVSLICVCLTGHRISSCSSVSDRMQDLVLLVCVWQDAGSYFTRMSLFNNMQDLILLTSDCLTQHRIWFRSPVLVWHQYRSLSYSHLCLSDTVQELVSLTSVWRNAVSCLTHRCLSDTMQYLASLIGVCLTQRRTWSHLPLFAWQDAGSCLPHLCLPIRMLNLVFCSPVFIWQDAGVGCVSARRVVLTANDLFHVLHTVAQNIHLTAHQMALSLRRTDTSKSVIKITLKAS